ncbi:hypothetical protein [Actinoplanes sp. NPDC049316]|uniref:hypothetical protein n=1 Tax=Actinoplanes sp. NPDC049316 TaxID=3154727 RepID=UPI00343B555B
MFLKALLRAALAWPRTANPTMRSDGPGLTVWADLARLDHLAADAAGTDELPTLFTLMNPGGRDFGTDVAAFIEHCSEQQILRFAAPVTAVDIEATVSGDYRDGGFLVMVTIADRITMASGQLIPQVFRDADDLPRQVLAVVVDVADHAYREFLQTAADLAASAS